MVHEATITQNRNCDTGLNLEPTLFLVNVNGGRIKITRAAASAITPPSLFGIDRKMAYSQRKYHSG